MLILKNHKICEIANEIICLTENCIYRVCNAMTKTVTEKETILLYTCRSNVSKEQNTSQNKQLKTFFNAKSV